MLCHVLSPRGAKTRKKSSNILGTSCSNLTLSCQVFVCARHVFPPLFQLWNALWVFGFKTTQELVMHVFLPILQFWKYLPKENIPVQDWWARRMLRKRTYQLERHESRLGRDCLCLLIGQSLLVWKRAIIRSFLLLAYTISQCRYQSMHLASRIFFTPLNSMLATETQFSPPAGNTFKLDYGYHLRTSYKVINLHSDWYSKSLFAGPYGVLCIDLAIIVIYHCWSVITKKGRMYKNIPKYEIYKEVRDG